MRTTYPQPKEISVLYPQYDPNTQQPMWKMVTFPSQEAYEKAESLYASAVGYILSKSDAQKDLLSAFLSVDMAPDYELLKVETSQDGLQRTFYVELHESDADRTCKECGSKVVVGKRYSVTLKHLPYGDVRQSIRLQRAQYRCPKCGKTHIQEIPFRDADHRITVPLKNFICSLLATNTLNYLQIAELTGVDKNIIIKINEKRLKDKYTENGSLKKPQAYSRFLCIDEFLLHKNRRYATIIIDYETGQILWAQNGKKKQVVKDFVEHVGTDWLSHVEAVACDMNSDFEEEFRSKGKHIIIVNDHFHLIKNFNEMVIDKIRKDLIKEAKAMGDIEGWELLKRTKYLLCSSFETLLRKDEEAARGKVVRKENPLFKGEEVTRKGGNVARYEAICNRFPVFEEVYVLRGLLEDLYKTKAFEEAEELFSLMVAYCKEHSLNDHLYNFGCLLERHKAGIIGHALHQISSGKIEGINQRIKTMRRSAYGLPKDERFFLRLLDLHGPKEAEAA